MDKPQPIASELVEGPPPVVPAQAAPEAPKKTKRQQKPVAPAPTPDPRAVNITVHERGIVIIDY